MIKLRKFIKYLGEVITDMNKDFGNIYPDQGLFKFNCQVYNELNIKEYLYLKKGADTIIYLASTEDKITGGQFWYEKRPLNWADPNLSLSIFH